MKNMSDLRLAFCQFNPVVGDPSGNADRLLKNMADARSRFGADIFLAPEMAISGYPPEDLLLRQDFLESCESSLARLAENSTEIALLVGYPQATPEGLRNRVGYFRNGKCQAFTDKQILPNYAVFDEQRYFTAGQATTIVEQRGIRIGLLICEDVWESGPCAKLMDANVDLVAVINASPFCVGKLGQRIDEIKVRQAETGLPFVYLNQTGGQDDLVFDGGSFCIGRSGMLKPIAPQFQETLSFVDFDRATGEFTPEISLPSTEMPRIEQLHNAVCLGIRDYLRKNKSDSVLLGLSGGIDSAVTLALAVDAYGADKVRAVMLPSLYTSSISLDGARRQAENQQVAYDVIPIDDMFQVAKTAIAADLKDVTSNVATENLQSRIRGSLLMALSNQTGALVLATGNKSEMAVGYATIYGDMCGAYAPLKDVYKTQVYELARFINRLEEIIPNAVIERPPSAELRPDQKDSDSLPDYSQLDAVLERFIDRDLSVQEICTEGYDPELVKRMTSLVFSSEYKRRQSAPGPKVSNRAFGKDRRFPISSGWRD